MCGCTLTTARTRWPSTASSSTWFSARELLHRDAVHRAGGPVDDDVAVELDQGRGGVAAEPEAVGLERVAGVRAPPASPMTQAAITRGTSSSGGGTSWWSSQAVSMVASRNSSLGDQRPQEAGVGGQPEDRGVVEGGDQRPPRGLAVGAVRDDLAEHRVVRRADDLAALERVVDADAVAGVRPRTRLVVPAWGRKPPKESSA